MNRVTLTYEIAMAASRDAGNRSMRQAGRKKWNREDWSASVEVFERLRPFVELAGSHEKTLKQEEQHEQRDE